MRSARPAAQGCAAVPSRLGRFCRTAGFSSIPPRVVLFDPLPVAPGLHVVYPALIVQIPLHGLADPALESLGRFPAQLALDLARVDRIAAVVTGAVLNISDQRTVSGKW